MPPVVRCKGGGVTVNPNSVVLICSASDADRVNEEVAALLGDADGARNLSRELSADGASVTHFAGHAWLTDEQVKALSGIAGLTMHGAVIDGKPFDNWLVALKTAGIREVERDEQDASKLTVAARREPVDAKRIEDAKAIFNATPDIRVR